MTMSLLYEHVEARPDSVAIVYGDQRITFGELVERIERVASGLARQGIEQGDPVALVLADDPWFIVAFHAVASLGAIVLPVNPAFKQAELDFSLRSSKVAAIISDERTAGVCERIAASLPGEPRVITTSSGHGQARTLDAVLAEGRAGRLPQRDGDEKLLYQFSSGSTGRPKRVVRTHRQVLAEAGLYKSLGLTPEDRIFGAVPMFSSWGMGSCLLAAAAAGAMLVTLDDPHPFLLRRRRALELLEQERVTVFPGVPFFFRLLAEAPGAADLSSLRLCFSAGTALPRPVFEAFGERFGVLVRQLYGSTETAMICANMSEDPLATFDSVGAPVAGVSVEIVGDDGARLPAGEVGEVSVTSPAASYGYADADEESMRAFREGSYRPGDLGRVDEEGRLYLEGRKKLLIEVGGYKVDPIEVQDVILTHPAVAEAIVVGSAGESDGEEIVKAVVVPAGDCEERELIAFCRERLANFKVPRIVEFRDEIPTSPLGKILRKYLV